MLWLGEEYNTLVMEQSLSNAEGWESCPVSGSCTVFEEGVWCRHVDSDLDVLWCGGFNRNAPIDRCASLLGHGEWHC